jgi:CRP/FNR family transcriptional regulator, nitrogen fixation regulation protein
METTPSAQAREFAAILPPQPLSAMESLAIPSRYENGEAVYRCNDPVEYWYRIVAGAARMSALTADGSRHIVDFLLPGDLFGFGAQGTRVFCVEAIVPATLIVRYPRRGAEQLADFDPQIARGIREAAFDSIARLQRRMIILARTSALERVSAFLLEMADRCRGASPNTVFLPMSRYDIADYLGMAVETVSRALTELRNRRAIALRGVRRVQICDRSALEDLADRLAETGALPLREARWNGAPRARSSN